MATEDMPGVLRLRALRDGMPAITSSVGAMMAEACAVVMEGLGHSSGTLLPTLVHLSEKIERQFAIEFEDVSEQMRQAYREPTNAVELAACGVAILLVKEILGLVVIQ